jgi:hypothetical protein
VHVTWYAMNIAFCACSTEHVVHAIVCTSDKPGGPTYKINTS